MVNVLDLAYYGWSYRVITSDNEIYDNLHDILIHLCCRHPIDYFDQIVKIDVEDSRYRVTDNFSKQTIYCMREEIYGKILAILFNPFIFCDDKYLYLHGGAVVKNGIAVCYLAPSAMGKTTLTLDFMKRGYEYLTDDIIPISMLDFSTHGFPKPLFLRPDTIHENNSEIIIKNGDILKKIYVPENHYKNDVIVKQIFVLNRDLKYASKGGCDILHSTSKFDALLYNIYYAADRLSLIKNIAKMMVGVDVFNVNYFNSDQAIDIINQKVQN